ncbi:hypothetical protein SAMN05443667_111139 [Flavobacterium gillisiae]|jgi:uncharacterized Tic20 family protein|uniref:DUF4870 domain-containing protein n=1 Tax=Flavobacterium gillisiae TaxID=150146 RepID=A0A1H4F1G0_9FLAO|nr:DUF4870 domain-containing protein [Flavobacterium gillisiae]SEA91061.1 hypothetical protein SAMN05443667_111139 [Flavobacterium gillisiae]|tara:strand:- start:10894 stop:11349 length:456 start_codon:yes stop_codon:yes gene_type:complete
MEATTEKNIATFTHLSALTQYFIPFGNYIFPIILWTSKKDKSEFVDYSGKQILNFQLSVLLYTIALALIAIPILIITIFNNVSMNAMLHEESFVINHLNFENNIALITLGLTTVFVFICLKIAEFFLIIYASIKTSNGEKYKYPITIPFIK